MRVLPRTVTASQYNPAVALLLAQYPWLAGIWKRAADGGLPRMHPDSAFSGWFQGAKYYVNLKLKGIDLHPASG